MDLTNLVRYQQELILQKDYVGLINSVADCQICQQLLDNQQSLGSGSYGEVYLKTFRLDGQEQSLAIKISKANGMKFNDDLDLVMLNMIDTYEVTIKEIRQFNLKINPSFPDQSPFKKYLYTPPLSEKIGQPDIFFEWGDGDHRGVILLPEYAEYVIASRLSSHPNFLQTYYFGLCNQYQCRMDSLPEIAQHQYAHFGYLNLYIMEQAQGDIIHLLKKFPYLMMEDDLYNLAVQVIGSVAYYQEQNINHNDLSATNILYIPYTSDQDLTYEVKDPFSDRKITVSLPADKTTYLAKIADFGMAMDYTPETGIYNTQIVMEEDEEQIWPFRFNHFYDLIVFFRTLDIYLVPFISMKLLNDQVKKILLYLDEHIEFQSRYPNRPISYANYDQIFNPYIAMDILLNY